MKTARLASSLLFAAAALGQAGASGAGSTDRPTPCPLEGTWTLVAADLLHADGTRTRDYGASPSGRLMVDAAGRYALQIYKAERPRFANADKAKGTAAEFEAAAMGSSVHFGTLSLDPTTHQLTVHIEHSTFPNWEGTSQVRQYTLEGEVLSYQVPPRSDGTIPLSVWRRVK